MFCSLQTQLTLTSETYFSGFLDSDFGGEIGDWNRILDGWNLIGWERFMFSAGEEKLLF